MKKLLVFGVGLIGGSLALALKAAQTGWHVTGIGRTGDSLQEALALGIIDEAASDLAAALKDADIVMIATPVAQIAPILQRIAPYLEDKTVITDAGSTKADIAEQAQNILGKAASRFVPGHPIAGAEKSGPAAAQANLYQNRNVVLTPGEQTDPAALNAVRELWLSTGAIVREMSASSHDTIFAAVSHLPHLLAFALVDELAARPDANQFFEFAASGFRDFTRIAGSSPEMWRDISLANRTALLQELDHYQAALSGLREILEQGDSTGLQALFERASHARNDWARQQASASWKN
ncbi:prephenate dehydrogenase/arogenate dehydrogenase family protein [Methylobacillus arboreus]|uniref:prephenate dehydrogenase n=1 Tax=Methylobacillus arboreus TaxID=755170 RepID=UPI001E316A85|nr:prephenate dehydrogenase/arogenate dehydrogenase family protein [Methylobacillus arboreus]MCB5191752.1 prephenate dehydrogenase/arogenate dehydrogenase family protein [Methylobacillus arboreus]